MTVSLACKNCGSKAFKPLSEVKSLDEFNGAVCQKCGAKITKTDIEAQMGKIGENVARDIFKGLK